MDHPHSPDESGNRHRTLFSARAEPETAPSRPYWRPERWTVEPNARSTWDESPVVFTRILAQNGTSRPLPALSSFQAPIYRTNTPEDHVDESSTLHQDQDQDGAGGEQKQPEGTAPTKRSRYLREMDRREILSRIGNGERQCDLAKEYDVSRAAISNLFKHREEVLSRQDENPLSKHPKKARAQPSGNSPRDIILEPSRELERRLQASMLSRNAVVHRRVVHEVKSRAISLLITTLHDRRVSIEVFRGHASRLLRLLLEEALAFVPFRPVDVGLTADATTPGFVTEFPPCAISMENHGTPMLDQFHLMEPDQPSGVLEIRPAVNGTIASSVRLFNSLLPATLEQLNVFLLVPLAISSQVICLALENLLTEQADESMILVVCVVVSADVIATVYHRFPRVRIMTAEIDATPMLTSNSSNPDSSALCQLLLDRWISAYSTPHSPFARR